MSNIFTEDRLLTIGLILKISIMKEQLVPFERDNHDFVSGKEFIVFQPQRTELALKIVAFFFYRLHYLRVLKASSVSPHS